MSISIPVSIMVRFYKKVQDDRVFTTRRNADLKEDEFPSTSARIDK